MKILLVFLLICELIFENKNNLIEAGKIKHQISFDEIFGQRWDDGAKENICQIDQIIHGESADQNYQIGQNGRQFDQIIDEILEVKKEESEEMHSNCDELGQLPVPTKNGQIYDKFSNAIDKKNREIVENFHKIKEKVKQMGKKYSKKEWQKIERKIAKKLGTNQREIYKWKREFGMNRNRNKYSDEEKHKILKQFDQIYGKIKMKLNEKLEGKKQKFQKIIAKHLGIPIKTIYYWKKQSVNWVNERTDDEKREIVEKYFKIKNEFMQNGKHSRKEWKEFRAKTEPLFGVNSLTIENWAKKLNIKQKFSKGKEQIVNQFNEMKNEFFKSNPKANNRKAEFKIAKEMGRRFKTINRWRKELKQTKKLTMT